MQQVIEGPGKRKKMVKGSAKIETVAWPMTGKRGRRVPAKTSLNGRGCPSFASVVAPARLAAAKEFRFRASGIRNSLLGKRNQLIRRSAFEMDSQLIFKCDSFSLCDDFLNKFNRDIDSETRCFYPSIG